MQFDDNDVAIALGIVVVSAPLLYLALRRSSSLQVPNVSWVDSPNHGGVRAETLGCVLHSTRGNAKDPQAEYDLTVSYFASSSSQVSAHAVVAQSGDITECVDPTLEAWHARSYNRTHLGIEFVQQKQYDPITDAQYNSAAWWLVQRSKEFGFPLDTTTLVEHKDIPPGIAVGKTDIGYPFDINRLLDAIAAWQ